MNTSTQEISKQATHDNKLTQACNVSCNWLESQELSSLMQLAMQHSIEYLIAAEKKYRAILWEQRRHEYQFVGDRWRPISPYHHVVTDEEQDIHTLLDILGVARFLKMRKRGTS